MAWDQIAAGGVINIGLLAVLARWIGGRFERIEKKLDTKVDSSLCDEKRSHTEENICKVDEKVWKHKHGFIFGKVVIGG